MESTPRRSLWRRLGYSLGLMLLRGGAASYTASDAGRARASAVASGRRAGRHAAAGGPEPGAGGAPSCLSRPTRASRRCGSDRARVSALFTRRGGTLPPFAQSANGSAQYAASHIASRWARVGTTPRGASDRRRLGRPVNPARDEAGSASRPGRRESSLLRRQLPAASSRQQRALSKSPRL